MRATVIHTYTHICLAMAGGQTSLKIDTLLWAKTDALLLYSEQRQTLYCFTLSFTLSRRANITQDRHARHLSPAAQSGSLYVQGRARKVWENTFYMREHILYVQGRARNVSFLLSLSLFSVFVSVFVYFFRIRHTWLPLCPLLGTIDRRFTQS
jgi:hypothetical protein